MPQIETCGRLCILRLKSIKSKQLYFSCKTELTWMLRTYMETRRYGVRPLSREDGRR